VEQAAEKKRIKKPAPELEPMPELSAEFDDPSVPDAAAAYQTQAMQNDPTAQLKLGLAYHVGRSVAANPKLACFWVMRSMLAGSYQAAQYLRYCLQVVPPEEHEKLQTTIFMWVPGQPVPPL
jgi:TPR repeat protein